MTVAIGAHAEAPARSCILCRVVGSGCTDPDLAPPAIQTSARHMFLSHHLMSLAIAFGLFLWCCSGPWPEAVSGIEITCKWRVCADACRRDGGIERSRAEGEPGYLRDG